MSKLPVTGQHCDFQFKLLTIGDTEVGKTCLLRMFADGRFNTIMMPTIGVDYKIKFVDLDDLRIKLQIWDTAGQERFHTITASYFRGAHGILLVYDVTKRSTLVAARNWVKQIEKYGEEDVSVVLVGNKTDLESQREVPREEGEALAAEFKVPYFETSAKGNVGVSEAFLCLTTTVKERVQAAGLKRDSASTGLIRLSEAPGTASSPSRCPC